MVFVVLGAVASNWWVIVPAMSGIVDPRLGLFSDLEVAGAPHASVFRGLDLVAGALFLAALLLRGPLDRDGHRRLEFTYLVAFCVAGMMGALSPYVCAESTYPTCRAMEWHFQLPYRHYLHILAGVAEFAFITVAAWLMHRRTRGRNDWVARVARSSVVVFLVAYPALATVYLADRYGAFVEPIFVVTFCAIVGTEVLESPRRHLGPSGNSSSLAN
jgi:hypothetical protein